jgi:hypothetical protein
MIRDYTQTRNTLSKILDRRKFSALSYESVEVGANPTGGMG